MSETASQESLSQLAKNTRKESHALPWFLLTQESQGIPGQGVGTKKKVHSISFCPHAFKTEP